MAKTRTQFVCTECANESVRWLGRCPGCSAWNTFEERIVQPVQSAPTRPVAVVSKGPTQARVAIALKDLEQIDLNAPVTIDGVAVTDESQINKGLRQLLKYDLMRISIGNFSIKSYGFIESKLAIAGLNIYKLKEAKYDCMKGMLEHGIAETLVTEKQKLIQAEQDLISLKETLGKPFEHLDKMLQMRSRLREIDLILQKEQQDKPQAQIPTYTPVPTTLPQSQRLSQN